MVNNYEMMVPHIMDNGWKDRQMAMEYLSIIMEIFMKVID